MDGPRRVRRATPAGGRRALWAGGRGWEEVGHVGETMERGPRSRPVSLLPGWRVPPPPPVQSK